MKIHKILIFCVLISLAITVQAQRVSDNQPLNIGDRVPDISVGKIINDKVTTARFTAFKDQLLILDFWNVNCSSCIEAMPNMRAMQTQFGAKIKVLCVDSQDKADKVTLFFQKNPIGKTTLLPSVIADVELNRLFKHWAMPFEVWIYKGIVVAKTSAHYVTPEHIQYILDGKTPDWPVVNDYQLNSGVARKQGKSDASYIGLVTGWVNGGRPSFSSKIDTIKKLRNNVSQDQSIALTYTYIWNLLGKDWPRIAFNVKDTARFIYKERFGDKSDWSNKNKISYESVYPDRGLGDSANYKTMLSDLDRLLGLETHWEKRTEKCFILTKGADSLKTNLPASLEGDQHDDDATVVLFRWSLDKTVEEALATSLHTPVVLGDNFSSLSLNRFRMRLKRTDLKDLASIKRALKPYNIELVEGEREFEYFVITEIGYQPKTTTAQIK